MTKEWEKPEDLRRRKPVLWLTMTALFMAMVVVLSMSALSIPVPGGHLYFNDVVIDTAAMLMDPLSAFIACGVGAFLGDLLFYPAPMFVSLITHGLQALVISLLCRETAHEAAACLRDCGAGGRDCHGGGLHAGTRVCVQHAGICHHEAAVPVPAGRCGRGDLVDSVLPAGVDPALPQHRQVMQFPDAAEPSACAACWAIG